MRGSFDVCGCFPTGRHYPGIADWLAKTVTDVEGLSATVEASARWLDQKLAIIDFETTGLEAQTDRVLEVGVACFENGALSSRKNWLVNPTIPVPEESRAVHKISDEELAKAPRFEEVFDELKQTVAGHLPVGYNAMFDQAFLLAELRRLGAHGRKDPPPAFDPKVVWIDPLVWARELHKEETRHRLTDVCSRLGISLDQAHRAAADAEATGHVLMALADKLPGTYGELIRLQGQYGARQEIDFSFNFRRR